MTAPSPNKILDWELARIDWPSLRTASRGGDARHVPDALRALAAATTEEQAQSALWQLDNHVVVQGTLHQASEFVVAPLLHIAATCPEIPRRFALDLLCELAHAGDSRPTPPSPLDGRCLQRLREGLAVLYGCLESADVLTRRWSVLLLERAETDTPRLRSIAQRLATSDPDDRVRSDASHVLRRIGASTRSPLT